ncbi:MAG TPA: hypothetical protein VFC99_07510 [Acidimicrobiia bacterium]|nr:hypothetical protein [Acidimicrobiia bacterium]
MTDLERASRSASPAQQRASTSPIGEASGCGPDGCTVDWLTSDRIETDDDPVAFTKLATDAGWGDGLPLIPPTEERVRAHLVASGRFPDECLAELPPRNGRATVEKVAVNAVMAGAPPESMPLLCAAIEAMADPEFNLFALNTTTSCVVPGIFVNGPSRDRLGIPYEAGCFGGAAGPGPAIGRATRLIMRNVGGQVVGVSSKSVFGQPGRVVGIVVGEWEERSPWAPFAERRGVAGDAVTVHGCTGTIDVADIVAQNGADLLEVIGKSLAFAGTNAFIGAHHGAEIMVCIAPPWADRIAREYPEVETVQRLLHEYASLPVDRWPAIHRRAAEENGRVDDRGMVHLVEDPDHLLVLVNGGLGNLHALALHSFGPTRAVTRAF